MLHHITHRLARRFVAGTTIHGAIDATKKFNAEGIATTIDILLETPKNSRDAANNVQEYLHLLGQIKEQKLNADISLKLNILGLSLGEKICEGNLTAVVKEAAAKNIGVTVDMEEHRYKEATLRLFSRTRKRYKNVRVVLQAYLHSSVGDAQKLLKEKAPMRLVKGVYTEPGTVAYLNKERIDQSFVAIAKMMLAGKPTGMKHAFGTHDEGMVALVDYFAHTSKRSKDSFEFQTLYGVKPELAEKLKAGGHNIRVYVPYGKKWMGYVLRRLREGRR